MGHLIIIICVSMMDAGELPDSTDDVLPYWRRDIRDGSVPAQQGSQGQRLPTGIPPPPLYPMEHGLEEFIFLYALLILCAVHNA